MKYKLLAVSLVLLLVTIGILGCQPSAPKDEGPVTTPKDEGTVTAPKDEGPITISFALHDPPVGAYAPLHMGWAEEFEEKTGGRYKVEFAWGGAMGPIFETWELVNTGVADIGFVLTNLEVASFPLTSVLELPFVATNSPDGGKVFWQLYESGLLDSSYEDVKLLYGWNSLGERLFMPKGPITGLANVKGKKIIATSPSSVTVVEALGGVPVSVALPEQYMAIQKGTADGSWSEWGTFAPYKLWEVLSYSIDPGLKSIALIAVMNKNTYDQMPQDIQKIVDEMISSKKYVDWACQINFDVTSAARQEVLDRGGEITEWSAGDWDKIATNLAPAWQEWLSNVDSKGLDGQKVLDEAYKIMKGLGIEDPAIGYKP